MSLSWILDGLDPNGKVTSIENDPDCLDVARSFFAKDLLDGTPYRGIRGSSVHGYRSSTLFQDRTTYRGIRGSSIHGYLIPGWDALSWNKAAKTSIAADCEICC